MNHMPALGCCALPVPGLPQCECFFVQTVPERVGKWEQGGGRYTAFPDFVLWISVRRNWVAGILCESGVGRINESQLAVHPWTVPCKQTRRGHCSLSWGTRVLVRAAVACPVLSAPFSCTFGNTEEIPEHCS